MVVPYLARLPPSVATSSFGRARLPIASIGDARPETEGLRTAELRSLLQSRGVDTAGIFERGELLRLLTDLPRTERPRLPDPSDMHAGDIMTELDQLGVDFDVLSPTHTLATLLRRARAGNRHSRVAFHPGQRQEHATAESIDESPDSGPPVAADQPKEIKTPDLLPLVVGAATTASTLLSRALGEASAVATGMPDALTVRSRFSLSRRFQAALLALCLCALRFGIARTVLIAVSLKLTQELVVGSVWPGPSRRRARRDTA